MFYKTWFSFIVLCNVLISLSTSLNKPFTESDVKSISAAFHKSLEKKDSDLSDIAYAIDGLNVLNEAIPKETCDKIRSLVNPETNSLSNMYFLSIIKKAFASCQFEIKDIENLASQFDSQTTCEKLYQIQEIVKRFRPQKTVETQTINDKMVEIISRDASIRNLAFYLRFAYENPSVRKLDTAKTHIATLLSRASIANQQLQWNNGVAFNGLVIDTLAKFGKLLPDILTEEQVLLLSNYLLTSKHQTNPKNAASLYQAIKSLADYKPGVPIISRIYGISDLSPQSPYLIATFTNLLDKPLVTDEKMVLKPVLKYKDGDDTIKTATGSWEMVPNTKNTHYQFNAYKANIFQPGQTYEVWAELIEPPMAGKKYFGLTVPSKSGLETLRSITLKLTTKISISDAVIMVNNEKHALDTNSYTKLTNKINILPDKEMSLSFRIVSQSDPNKDINAQQIALIFKPNLPNTLSSSTNQQGEVTFYAEAKKSSDHKIWTFDIKTDSKTGKLLSTGAYALHLVIGDSSISNSIDWHFADVQCEFPVGSTATTSGKYFAEKEKQYEPKPEIKHTFKTPEARPSKIVSLIFCGLVILPFLLLLILWNRTGFNLGKMILSPWALLFHLTLAAIFGLYFLFWLKLDMFTTLRYMSLLGPLLFFTGNRLLRSLAQERKKQA